MEVWIETVGTNMSDFIVLLFQHVVVPIPMHTPVTTVTQTTVLVSHVEVIYVITDFAYETEINVDSHGSSLK
jgi:hypothetical protein